MKKKNNIPETVKCANVLIYDDKNITYYQGTFTSFKQKKNWIDCGRDIEGNSRSFITDWTVILDNVSLNQLDNITLDETTMKRIATYNKIQECKKLDKQIQEKEERIKELDNLLKDKEKRWNKVKEYIKNIYEINLNENDDYYDYDDYYD